MYWELRVTTSNTIVDVLQSLGERRFLRDFISVWAFLADSCIDYRCADVLLGGNSINSRRLLSCCSKCVGTLWCSFRCHGGNGTFFLFGCWVVAFGILFKSLLLLLLSLNLKFFGSCRVSRLSSVLPVEILWHLQEGVSSSLICQISFQTVDFWLDEMVLLLLGRRCSRLEAHLQLCDACHRFGAWTCLICQIVFFF